MFNIESALIIAWLKDHSLTVFVAVVSLYLVYTFLTERGKGKKLTKKYRESIFEAQSKIFLNATQYLISGNKDMAIKEFLQAVDLNKETIDTYFALGRLFRANGEIEKAVSIHRGIIAREGVSESHRLAALKELATDFEKGGFLDKAIETYKDVLKFNREQPEVVKALCRVFEDMGDWDQSLNYRLMLSKVSNENQSETLSHILVEKAKKLFLTGEYAVADEKLEEAFRYAPSVSAKILQLKLDIVSGRLDDAKGLLLELLKEHPMYSSFIFLSLEDFNDEDKSLVEMYFSRYDLLKKHFLEHDEIDENPAIFLSKIRLLKTQGKIEEAFEYFRTHWDEKHLNGDVVKIEYIKLLIENDRYEDAVKHTKDLLSSIQQSSTRHYCSNCGFNSDDVFWRCPQCREWETIQFRWKV